MASTELRVDVETLKKITEIVENNPQGQQEVQKTIIEAINKLWEKTCISEGELALPDPVIITYPKKEYEKVLKELTGFSGPYTATKKCESWTGLSEGIYQIQNCPILVPVAWFKTPSKFYFNWNDALLCLLTIVSIIQSGLLLFLVL